MKEVVRLLEMAKEIQNMENELRKIMPTAEDIFDAKRYYDGVTEEDGHKKGDRGIH